MRGNSLKLRGFWYREKPCASYLVLYSELSSEFSLLLLLGARAA